VIFIECECGLRIPLDARLRVEDYRHLREHEGERVTVIETAGPPPHVEHVFTDGGWPSGVGSIP
jgi:hypothetical protein